jgi:integrase
MFLNNKKILTLSVGKLEQRVVNIVKILLCRDISYIFTTKNGVPIQTNSFNLALKKANERLEKPIQKNLTSHIFRHTLVSRLAENRVPLKAIMDRVGHADAKTTTQIYTHITKKLKANVAEIMENY